MVGYAADAGRFFIYVALLNMFQVREGSLQRQWRARSCPLRAHKPCVSAALPRPRAQLTSETLGMLCALCTSRSMYAVITLTFVSRSLSLCLWWQLQRNTQGNGGCCLRPRSLTNSLR